MRSAHVDEHAAGERPSVINVSSASGTAATDSHANRSNIVTLRAARSQQIADRENHRRDHQHGKAPDAEIVARPVPQISGRPIAAMPNSILACGRYLAKRQDGPNATVNRPGYVRSRWEPQRQPCAMPKACAKTGRKPRGAAGDQQWPRHIRLRTNRQAPDGDGKRIVSSASAAIRRAPGGSRRRPSPRSRRPGREKDVGGFMRDAPGTANQRSCPTKILHQFQQACESGSYAVTTYIGARSCLNFAVGRSDGRAT